MSLIGTSPQSEPDNSQPLRLLSLPIKQVKKAAEMMSEINPRLPAYRVQTEVILLTVSGGWKHKQDKLRINCAQKGVCCIKHNAHPCQCRPPLRRLKHVNQKG